ncbi:cupin domain-containing protein [bacterium]|nr:cupin domain-containing protein [bacterium]
MDVKIEKIPQQRINELKISSWPIWRKEKSRFPWHYDSTEECFILEGEVTVIANGEEFHFGAGDFVTFSEGLSCEWIITKDVKKHYRFL